MQFAKRLDLIKPSATLAINAKALELKKQGIDVISLAVGEPDFNTPCHIEEAAKAAIDEHFTRYTDVSGISQVKSAVCNYFKQSYQVETKTSQVIVSNGGKQILYNLFLALLNEDDEILIPVPYWTSYPEMVILAGAKPVFIPSGAEKSFKINVDDLEKYCTKKTKVLLLNSPSNPSGAAYSQEELDALIMWAIERDIFIISDEVYDKLVYEPEVAASASILWQKYPNHIAVVNSLSKSFAMTGWRAGFALACEALTKELVKLQGQTTSNICSITQKAVAVALSSAYDCIIPMKEAFKKRRDFAHAEVSSWPDIICPKPEGAFYLFPDVRNYFTEALPNSTALCSYLLDEAKVALIPGEAFGDGNCLRISYAVADDVLKKALESIKNALLKRP